MPASGSETRMPLSAGGRLGPYEVVGLLGAGGMGVVYRARDPRLGREVAIKVLPNDVSADPRRLERFRREARAVAALDHPNILAVHDVGTEDGAPYAVFELVDGQTLRELLAGGPLAPSRALDLAAQLARGLAAAHREAIVHRDIKPENLLVTRQGILKIVDFGLATARAPEDRGVTEETRSRLTGQGDRPGTPAYMSPEQVAGQTVDRRSDLFSLGVVVHEMLCGRPPFLRATSPETMVAILKEWPGPLPESVRNEVPGLPPVLDRCLAKDPEGRFQSAADLEFALQQALGPASESAVAREPRAGGRWLAGAAGLLALAAAGLVWAWVATRPPLVRAPTLQRLSFRRGTIWSGRFAPDGQTVVYSAAWEGRPIGLFETRVGSKESRSLELGAAEVLSISPTGEMALSLNPSLVFTFVQRGTLARSALTGGAPREVARNVDSADFLPGGRDVVYSTGVGGKERVELTNGRVLYEGDGVVNHIRVSPDGHRYAFLEQDAPLDQVRVMVVSDEGERSVLSRGWRTWSTGLAWAPSGREVWFTAAKESVGAALRAVDLQGHQRLVARVPGGLQLLDISRDGRVLLAHVRMRNGLVCRPRDAEGERDLSWLDLSVLCDLTPDGGTVAFQELSTEGWSVYLRRVDGSPAVHLGDGVDFGVAALSPDGQWVLATKSSPSPELLLLPTGPGQTRHLPRAGIDHYDDARWLPDGTGVAFLGRAAGPRALLCVQDLATGRVHRLASGSEWSGLMVSPDGRSIGVTGAGGLTSYRTDGSGFRPVARRFNGVPLGWSADARFVYSYRVGELPGRVYRTNVKTDASEVWKELMPADPAGVWRIHPIRVSPDGRSYAYNYFRVLSDVYVYEGLR
jgi:Tol biopolymer transport system component